MQLIDKQMQMVFPTPMFTGKVSDLGACDRVEKKLREMQKSGQGLKHTSDEKEGAGRRRWARPSRSRHVFSERAPKEEAEKRPVIRTALRVAIFQSVEAADRRRRLSEAGSALGVPFSSPPGGDLSCWPGSHGSAQDSRRWRIHPVGEGNR